MFCSSSLREDLFAKLHLKMRFRRCTAIAHLWAIPSSQLALFVMALTHVAGERHGVVELRIPDVEDATKLFLKHLGYHEIAANEGKIQEVVKGIGRLPLAIAQAASYMTETGSSLDDMLSLFSGKRKFDVGIYFRSLIVVC